MGRRQTRIRCRRGRGRRPCGPIRVGFPLHGGESPLSDLRDAPVEVIDEHQVPGVPSVLEPPLDEDVPALRELPYSLSVGGEE